MKLLFTKEGALQIGGFGAIGGMFSPTWGLAFVLVYDGTLVVDSCFHEYPTYSSLGWWSCYVLCSTRSLQALRR